MKPITDSRCLALAACLIFFAQYLEADVVETRNGARLTGTIISISGGTVTLDTEYAGRIAIRQGEVASITTDAPVVLRLASGTQAQGRVIGSAAGLQVAAAEGALGTQVGQLAALWPVGGLDPEAAEAGRDWSYEASVDVTGRSGSREQLGTSASLRATLSGPRDRLAFHTGYDRQVTDGRKSADQFRAGADYSARFGARNSWYVRDEGGFDRIRDIQFYNIAAVGAGYSLIDSPGHELTSRLGLSHRAENYRNPATADVGAAGLDAGLEHRLDFRGSRLVNRLAYVPSFGDFGDFRLNQESFLELPLASPSWKLRTGFSNDYRSRAAAGIERLDTAYFTRLTLTWR